MGLETPVEHFLRPLARSRARRRSRRLASAPGRAGRARRSRWTIAEVHGAAGLDAAAGPGVCRQRTSVLRPAGARAGLGACGARTGAMDGHPARRAARTRGPRRRAGHVVFHGLGPALRASRLRPQPADCRRARAGRAAGVGDERRGARPGARVPAAGRRARLDRAALDEVADAHRGRAARRPTASVHARRPSLPRRRDDSRRRAPRRSSPRRPTAPSFAIASCAPAASRGQARPRSPASTCPSTAARRWHARAAGAATAAAARGDAGISTSTCRRGASGRVTVLARATDDRGRTQPSERIRAATCERVEPHHGVRDLWRTAGSIG